MRHLLSLALLCFLFLASAPAYAQLSGTLIKGQYGLTAGTQAPEGLVLTPFAYDYYSTQIVDPSGTPLSDMGSLNIYALPGINLWYVSPFKILGANYGAVLTMWGTGSRTEFPTLKVSTSTYGFGDMFLKPVELGWHTAYVDVITGFALWMPTGRYTLGGDNNTGLGQWGYEFSLGATLWFDEGHHFNLSVQAFYDIYSPKKGGPIGPSNTQVQTGNTFTLQGGLGYRFLGGGLNIGIPYFVQWKVTEDTLPPGIGGIIPTIQAGKDWSVGLGAEADFYWCTTDGVTLRFIQSFAGANTSNGSSYFLLYNHVFYFGR